jgi:hypothetical protein
MQLREREREHGAGSAMAAVIESSSLARFRGACLPLDTKCPESELNQDDSVEHTRRENSNNPHFTPEIQ